MARAGRTPTSKPEPRPPPRARPAAAAAHERGLQVLDSGCKCASTDADRSADRSLQLVTLEHGRAVSPGPLDRRRPPRVRTTPTCQQRIDEAARAARRASRRRPAARQLRRRRRDPAGAQRHRAGDRRRRRRSLIVGIGLLLALALPVLDRPHGPHDPRREDGDGRVVGARAVLDPGLHAGRDADEIARPGTAREAAFRGARGNQPSRPTGCPRRSWSRRRSATMQDTVAANFAAALAGIGVRVALDRHPAPPGVVHARRTRPRHGNGRTDGQRDRTATGTGPRDDVPGAARARVLGPAQRRRARSTCCARGSRTCGCCRRVTPRSTSPPTGCRRCSQAFASANIDVTVIAAPALLEDPNTTIYAWTTRSVLWVMETGEITVEAGARGARRAWRSPASRRSVSRWSTRRAEPALRDAADTDGRGSRPHCNRR